MIENLVIVGSGPAGLSCAIYAARSNLTPIVIAGSNPGGQLMKTDVIQNYPGIANITGPDLMINMINHAENVGTKIIYDNVTRICKKDNIFSLTLENEDTITAKSVVYAAGAKHKKLGIPGEEQFSAHGVSWCATCDGAYYKSKNVAVVGGGNTALMEALFLSNLATNVYLIHRNEKFRADIAMQDRIAEKSNIKTIMNSNIVEICGSNCVEYAMIKNNNDNIEKLVVDGIFIAIGSSPEVELLKDFVDLDEFGYIKTTNTQTSCSGLFAAGDVVSGALRQAVCAAAMGAQAAVAVEKYLEIR